MIFDSPVDFITALGERKAKLLLPNDLSHDELSRIDAGIREFALACAHATNAQFLQAVSDSVGKIIGGKSTNDVERRQLQGVLDSIGYAAPEGARGIQDLRSDGRLQLILRTLVGMAGGYGQWRQHQNPGTLAAYPAMEFYRGALRKEPRDWPTRWAEAGGRFFPGRSDYPQGRMIAKVNDPIWVAINRFGVPYTPTDFNSGMMQRPIPSAEAVQLGVVKPGEVEEPQRRDFGKDFGAAVDGLTPELEQALLESLGPDYHIEAGTLFRANERLIARFQNGIFIANISAAQQRAGNYPKRHLRLHGLDISIENPKGSVRVGTGEDGRPYRAVMPADYGYIRGTKGADGDQVDVFVGSKPSTLAFVADQRSLADGSFDENKTFINFPDAESARRAYITAYPDGLGSGRMASFQTMTIPKFKRWLRNRSATRRPVKPEVFA